MRKIFLFILISSLFMVRVSAKNINDLYYELNTLEEQKELYTYLSSDDMKEIMKTSSDIEIIVDTLNDEINNINNDILLKEDNIKSIEKEIDNLLIFNQISTGENTYLEYIFDSDSYSELIYRYMIVGQITKYNNSLIEKLNVEIEELNNKKDELNKKIEKINKERESFRELELILKRFSSNGFDSINTSLERDIVLLKEEIEKYEKLGCSRYTDLASCLNITNNNNLTYPLMKGCVTKDYFVGVSNTHKGIDLGCNKEGNYVYAAGYGVVANIVNKSSCGGNIVWIYHFVGGREYTTIYAHLLDIKVDIGSVVTPDTIIGTVGGESTSILNGGYDKCTNGAHLHYAVVDGFHTTDYNIYTFNPRYMNDYPDVLNGYFMRWNT